MSTPTLDHSTERTPLIHKSNSQSAIPDHTFSEGGEYEYGNGDEAESLEAGPKGREVEVYKPGKSTFTQTLLNVLGDLIGTGLLAMPIAAAHAGWLLGGIFLLIMAAGTLWTLKILIRIIERDRRLRSFTDVIGHGLGPRAQYWLTCFFIVEFLVWNVALVVLASDSLEAVIPRFSSDQWKLLCFIVVLPLSFVPLRYLSLSSFIGVLTTWGIIGILVFSGIATEHSPGSLREPMPTSLWPAHGLVKLGTTFGLIAAAFGGHGLIPNLVHDMAKPRQADRVVEVAYAIAMLVNVLVSVSGYLMYGTGVSDEVSRDLAKTPGFSPNLNWVAVLLVALNPLTKLPLSLRPMSDIIYTLFHLHPAIYIPNSVPTPRYTTRPNSPTPSATSDPGPDHPHILDTEEIQHEQWERRKKILRPAIRVLLAILAVAGGMILPSFESVMALLGSGFALVTVVIIPIWAGAELWGWTWYAAVCCGLSGVVAVVGIVTSFWPGQGVGAGPA